MKTYVVLYRDNSLLPEEAPLAYRCEADDTQHAEEQCEDENRNCEVVWVYAGYFVESAYDSYFGLD